MAYIAASNSFTIRDLAGEYSSAVLTPILPRHNAGDLLMCCLTQDTGGTEIATTSTGWAMIGTQAASGSSRQAWAYKVAASSSEPDPTFSGANDQWSCVAIVVRDADQSSPIHAFARSDYISTPTAASPALTTTADDCLLLYSWGSGLGVQMRLSPDDLMYIGLSVDQCATLVGRRTQTAAGDIPSVTISRSTSAEGGNAWAIAVANASGGSVEPWVVPGWEFVLPLDVMGGTLTWSAPNSVPGLTAVGGYSLHSVAQVTHDPGYVRITSEDAHVTPTWVGGWTTLSAAVDVTGSIMSIQFYTDGSPPPTALTMPNDGILLMLADASGRWAAFTLARREDTEGMTVKVSHFSPSTGNRYDESATAMDLSAVTMVGLFYLRGNSPANLRVYLAQLVVDRRAGVLCGGTVSSPATFSILSDGYNNGPVFGRAIAQGGSQFLCISSLQIGDPAQGATAFDASGQSFALPVALDGVVQRNWNVGPGFVSLSVLAGDGDTVRLMNCTISTGQLAQFVIDAATSLSATYDFSGMVLSGYTVSWHSGVECSRAVFIECSEIDAQAAAITSCMISRSTGTHAISMDSGGSLAGTKITKGGDTYAVNLRTAGGYDLSGCDFIGYTTPVHVTATTGTVTLTLGDGDSAPDYVSEGATVVIAPKAVAIDITGMIEGSVLAIYRTSDHAEIVAPTVIGASGAYSTTYSWTGNVPITVVVRKATGGTKYLPYSAPGLITSGGFSLIVNQVADGVLNG